MDTRWMPMVSGILDIIVGVVSLIGSLLFALLFGVFFSSSYDGFSGQQTTAFAVWLIIFLPYFVISIVAIIGGVFALRKKVWGLALAGSICSILTLWAWAMGIASIVFIALSRAEFSHKDYLFPSSVIPPPSSPPGQTAK
jgi:hypothetical protein